ncbi:MAG TPA: coagulation factor 5/8 type domain-containing protein [Rhodanobacteraceae bacterium]|nr:coagulation factor 5/8 type domain-containing protein [Rhodanobacteraceae bacterium]
MKSLCVLTVLCALLASAAVFAQTPEAQKAANEKVEALAKHAPRGFFPRGFSGEQVYWALVGVEGGRDSGLLSEDGALEIGKNGFSIEPVLVEEGRPVTWADVAITHTLRDGYLPIPSVTWKRDDMSLRITAFGVGTRERSELVARYELRNDGDRARDITFAFAVRPLQVDPPTQFLNAAGGVSPIQNVAWAGNALRVDGRSRVTLLRKPDVSFAGTLQAGSIVGQIAAYAQNGRSPGRAHSIEGFASGAALYRVHLAPHSRKTFGIVAPLSGAVVLPEAAGKTDAWSRREEDAVAAEWHAKLDRVSLQLPSSAPRLADTLRSSLAWILISRNGAELRPGTRSYDRSWIRDGAMMSDALLRLGDTAAAREYALWYAPFQFANGKPPCCVDTRGADPTIENDSPGEFLHLIAQVWRYSGDRDFLEKMWPHARATVAYMQAQRETAACDDAKTKMFCGLLPASISHEGYSAHPEHSYWDDFWALTGYKDAVTIARALGKGEDAARYAKARDSFRHDLYASIRASVAAHHIGYIPGSAELGDFDATSTTIALEPGGELEHLQSDLPRGLLEGTFGRYWTESRARMENDHWKDYTPYEWRNVGVFARLGWRTRIPAMLDFFFAGQRPPGWNQWAEVVRRDPRAPGFVGDMPHAWVASDFIRSALDLFAYQRDSDQSLVLGAGVQPQWLDGGGVALRGLRTPYGMLDYSVKREGSKVIWTIDAGAHPPGGLFLTWPLPHAPGATTINGKSARWQNGTLRVSALPATVVVEVGRQAGPGAGDPPARQAYGAEGSSAAPELAITSE